MQEITLEEALFPERTQKTEQNRTPAEKQRQERIDKLIQLLFIEKKDMKTACQTIGIGRTTGYEYFRAWQETEESSLIDTEFWTLYNIVKQEDPAQALDILTKIKVKKMAIKAEVKLESTHTENVNINVKSMLAEYSKLLTTTGTEGKPVSANSPT